jgi:hypothetical protein
MSLANGYVGGIRSVFWRRVAIIFFAIPFMVISIAPDFLKVLPRTLWDGLKAGWDGLRDEFVFSYSTPIHMLARAAAMCWSAEWEPAEEA